MEGGLSSLIFLGFMIAIFYVLLIRPQKKRVEQHRALVNSVGLGDEVITIGGIYGTVAALRDEDIELEVAPGTKIRMSKSAIARRLTEDDEVTDDAAGDEADRG